MLENGVQVRLLMLANVFMNLISLISLFDCFPSRSCILFKALHVNVFCFAHLCVQIKLIKKENTNITIFSFLKENFSLIFVSSLKNNFAETERKCIGNVWFVCHSCRIATFVDMLSAMRLYTCRIQNDDTRVTHLVHKYTCIFAVLIQHSNYIRLLLVYDI